MFVLDPILSIKHSLVSCKSYMYRIHCLLVETKANFSLVIRYSEMKWKKNNNNEEFTQISSNSHTIIRNQSLNKTYHSASYTLTKPQYAQQIFSCVSSASSSYVRIMDLSSFAVVVRFFICDFFFFINISSLLFVQWIERNGRYCLCICWYLCSKKVFPYSFFDDYYHLVP